jgi:uncharacterized protein
LPTSGHAAEIMQTTQFAAPKGSEKIWSMLSHLSMLITPLVGIIFPLVVYFAMRGESEYLTENAKEALNFHISIIIYGLCCLPFLLLFIGFPMLWALWIASLILAIIAAVKASDGACYRYPLTLRFVK